LDSFVSKLNRELKTILKLDGLEIPIVIDGKEIYDRSQIEGYDPSDNAKVWYRYAVAKSSDVESAVKVAMKAFSGWNELGAEARSDILKRFGAIAHDEQEETIAIMARDAGKTVAEADPEVSEAIDFANYYAFSAISLDLEKHSSPVGVVVIVPPWNFPYAIQICARNCCHVMAVSKSIVACRCSKTGSAICIN
jgi:RHH-type proline utilization regulon transcriptional repressor/proline dehydrogenase/delta 1-pyrroline-5-carboxylate dehydrogenase